MHALIIEDEYVIADAIAEALERIGFTSFDLAQTEMEAVAFAERRLPDLITADLYLASGTGIGAVLTVCADRMIPAVFMTAAPQDVLKRMPDAVVLAKPFGEGALKEAVDEVMHVRHSFYFL